MQDRINALFARAENAFRARRYAAARTDLHEVLRAAGDHPAVLHLLALVEQGDAQIDRARLLFERALRVAPADPQLHNNYAILLEKAGDAAGALRHYDRALHHQPDFVDALINRASLHERAGRSALGEADARRAMTLAPGNAAAATTLGSVLRGLGKLDDAAEAFDAALARQPARGAALHGRARIALERGEPQAATLYRRLLATGGADRDAVLGFASALEADGDPQGEAVLAQAVAEQPDWIEGHRELVRMRSEAARDDAATGFESAIAARPRDAALHIAYWQTLAQLGRHADVLQKITDGRARLAWTPAMAVIEATCADEAGETAMASRLFAGLAETVPAAVIPQARHLLRAGAFDRAAALLHAQVVAQPGDIAAWAHLDIAWRLIADDRHHWLSGQPGLVRAEHIALDPDARAALATTLRGLHRTRAHPVEQSLRGGTQTRGALFARTDPVLRGLRNVLAAAVDAHRRALPPMDPTHPLLRHRDRALAITGSWSVRLEGGGFHISHVHPHGLLSSALYVSIPEALDHADRAGWLELGVPPSELGLSVAPVATIAPEPGLLALFPSYLFHGTRPFGAGERLTVAFDVAARPSA